MIIDGHAHAAGDFLNGDNIIRVLDENKVDYVVLIGSPQLNSKKNEDLAFFSTFAEKHPERSIYIINKIIKLVNRLNRSASKLDAANRYVHDLVKQHPDRMIQFYWVNPAEKDVIEKLDRDYAKYCFRGLKLHQCIAGADFKKECMHNMARWAEEKGMPIFIHLCSKKEANSMVQLITLYKNTNFIIAHLVGLEVFIDNLPNASNVFFDISCYQIVPKRKVEAAIKKFGADHVVMGSDTPYGKDNLRNVIDLIGTLKVSDANKELILGGNLKRLLKL